MLAVKNTSSNQSKFSTGLYHCGSTSSLIKLFFNVLHENRKYSWKMLLMAFVFSCLCKIVDTKTIMTNVDTKHYTILEKSLSRKMVAQSHIYPEYSKKYYLIHPLIASLNYIGDHSNPHHAKHWNDRKAAKSNIGLCVLFFFESQIRVKRLKMT